MKISSEKTMEVLIIHPEGRLDTLTAGEFEKEATSLMQESGLSVLIDFGDLHYISSAGLRSLLILAKDLKRRERKIALCSLNETIKEVFMISGFDTIINIYQTTDEGLAFLTGI